MQSFQSYKKKHQYLLKTVRTWSKRWVVNQGFLFRNNTSQTRFAHDATANLTWLNSHHAKFQILLKIKKFQEKNITSWKPSEHTDRNVELSTTGSSQNQHCSQQTSPSYAPTIHSFRHSSQLSIWILSRNKFIISSHALSNPLPNLTFLQRLMNGWEQIRPPIVGFSDQHFAQ